MKAPVRDEIRVTGLDLPTRIGVPEEERAAWQTLQADIVLGLMSRFEDMGDDLSKTVDYAAIATGLKALAAAHPRRLLETLAAEMAAHCLAVSGVAAVTITLKKRILPGVDNVCVYVQREYRQLT